MTLETKIAFSIDEFCHWAGIGRSLAYKEIERGRLQTKKVGRRTIVPTASALIWLENLQNGGAKNAAKVGRD